MTLFKLTIINALLTGGIIETPMQAPYFTLQECEKDAKATIAWLKSDGAIKDGELSFKCEGFKL